MLHAVLRDGSHLVARRRRLALAPVDRNDVDRLLEALEDLRARLREPETRPDAVEGVAADEDLACARRSTDSGREMNAFAAVSVEVPVRCNRPAGMRADPDVGREDLGVERPLDFDGGLDGRLRTLERREETVAGLLDDFATVIDDVASKQLVVPSQELLPFRVAERL
jgi:hypothetical protein